MTETTRRTRECEHCGKTLERRQFPTRPEAPSEFAKRRFCSRQCAAPSGACNVDGCDRPLLARGLCGLHYQRMSRLGATDLPTTRKPISEAKRAQLDDARLVSASVRRARREIDPHVIGARTLLAATCKNCGELRPGSAFASGGRIDQCNHCRAQRMWKAIKQDDEKRKSFHKASRLRAKRANDAMPKPRNNYLWTGPELEIIEREDLTAMQAGLMIGRSRAAVTHMRSAIRREPKWQRMLGAQS